MQKVRIFIFFASLRGNFKERMIVLSNESEIYSLVYGELGSLLTVSDISLNLWFGDMTIVKLTEDKVYLKTDNDYKKHIILSKYSSQLCAAFEKVLGFAVEPVIISTENRGLEEQLEEALSGKVLQAEPENTDKKENISEEEIKVYRANKSLLQKCFAEKMPFKPKRYNSEKNELETIPLYEYSESLQKNNGSLTISESVPNFDRKYTFDNFIVGETNKLAYSACTSVAKYPARQYNPLFIYGNPGLGKTHLLYAVTNEISKNMPSFNIVYVKCEDFTNELIRSISNNTTAAFREKYRNADVLLIDDIQFLGGKVTTQEEFFHTFDALYEANKQIIVSSDRLPREIKTLEERIRSRFEWGYITDIQPPDKELRMAIFRSKAESMELKVPNDVLLFLAENIKDNVRQIEGILKKLKAYSFMRGEKITVDLAKGICDEIISTENTITSEKIVSCIAEYFGISKEDIRSEKRHKEIAYPRHICVFLLRNHTNLSLIDIGKVINRDHTTVMSSFEKIKKEMENNKELERSVTEIIRKIYE